MKKLFFKNGTFIYVTLHEIKDNEIPNKSVRIINIRNESGDKTISLFETTVNAKRELSVGLTENWLSWQQVTEINEVLENFDYYFKILNQ